MTPRTAIGIDIGGTHLRAARVSRDGAIQQHAKAPSAADAASVLDRIARLIEQVDDASVAGIGIGIPGRVDFASRRVLSGGYVDLSKVNLADEIEQRFRRPVTVDNDCSMALVAECAVGAAAGARNVVMLTIGTGIGGAIMEGGHIVRARGTAGQLGHVPVDPRGLPCVCGRRGCVETVSSGTALGRHIADGGFPIGTTAAELLSLRERCDDAARRVLHAWAAPLRVAIDGLVAALDPEVVVLGGGLGRAAFEALAGVETAPSWYESRVVPAALGDEAGAIGAALASLPGPARIKRLVIVNGVPASGKSGVAHALSRETGWPVLSLDTVKNPFLEEIEGVDRPFNRKLGRASMRAMFALVKEAPAGTTAIMDAWFGFQPRDWIEALIADAGVDALTEIWCSAPPEVIGRRYGERAALRLPGHPGADYVPELVELADRARPLGFGRYFEIDTTRSLEVADLRGRLEAAFRSAS
ncbi:ROK family protein [Aureimonas leprariae]|uniref:ROK family protein n=1 Tax=Plantimonas leprariae TaxID=2615207 RepID=A0A7V7PS39_9HYPH|nr:ROK family protein [Aureimonas leprariae]KAB0681860.1 ROK family protein [Aureimonas leprariae]